MPFCDGSDAAVARLARDNAWTTDFTLRAIEEYRRFLYLAAFSATPLSPCKVVDQVWHFHILDMANYERAMIGIFGRQLYHRPSFDTASGPQLRMDAQFQQTIDAYREAFGEEPPHEIWPVLASCRNSCYAVPPGCDLRQPPVTDAETLVSGSSCYEIPPAPGRDLRPLAAASVGTRADCTAPLPEPAPDEYNPDQPALAERTLAAGCAGQIECEGSPGTLALAAHCTSSCGHAPQ